jgi:hypothetical protein
MYLMKVQKAYKYKLILSKEQEKILYGWLCTLKHLYNVCLSQRILNHKNFRHRTNYYDQANELPQVKKE